MPKEHFDIYFTGQLLAGQDPAAAREQVARLFKVNDSQLKALFSGIPVAVKRGVDLDTAAKYRALFRQAGALVEIRSAAEPGASAKPSPMPAPKPAATDAGWELAPPNTGSLEGYAPSTRPAPLPDISAMGLDAPGTLLDERLPLPEVDLDTSGMDLVGGEWSLEDCQPALAPPPPPDISGLSLGAPGAPLDPLPPPPAAPLPDISQLGLEEPAPVRPFNKP